MPVPGYVYILTNPRVPGVVKIGRSSDVQRRVEQLNAHAGVAGRWVVAGYVIVSDMDTLERSVHRNLAAVRDSNSGGSEIFECTADEAGAAVLEMIKESRVELFKEQLPATVRAEAERQKRERMLAAQRAELERQEQERRQREEQAAREAEIRKQWNSDLQLVSKHLDIGNQYVIENRTRNEENFVDKAVQFLFLAGFMSGTLHIIIVVILLHFNLQDIVSYMKDKRDSILTILLVASSIILAKLWSPIRYKARRRFFAIDELRQLHERLGEQKTISLIEEAQALYEHKQAQKR